MSDSSEDMLEFTGERMVPGIAVDDTFWDHVARYRFASGYVQNRDVIDIACGEGYGTAALRDAGARSVIGIDVAQDAVSHAKKKYGVDARCGSAEAIPLGNESVDIVVSFETIEHVPNPMVFISECRRVLKRDGILIISTPNKRVFLDGSGANPFHCSEMTPSEFKASLIKHFPNVQIYGQQWPAPWYMAKRGFGRVARGVRSRLFRRLSSSKKSRRTVELCSKKPSFIERLLWTDMVRPVHENLIDKCVYVVAVAKKK